MWDLPRPGLEPVFPALAGGFFNHCAIREAPKSIVYTRVHSWYCTFYGFWQMYNGMHPHHHHMTQNCSTALKFLCALLIIPFSALTLGNHWSFCCLHSFLEATFKRETWYSKCSSENRRRKIFSKETKFLLAWNSIRNYFMGSKQIHQTTSTTILQKVQVKILFNYIL